MNANPARPADPGGSFALREGTGHFRGCSVWGSGLLTLGSGTWVWVRDRTVWGPGTRSALGSGLRTVWGPGRTLGSGRTVWGPDFDAGISPKYLILGPLCRPPPLARLY